MLVSIHTPVSMKTLLFLAAFACASGTALAQTVPTPGQQTGSTSTSPNTTVGVQTAADHTGTPSGIVDAANANDAVANSRNAKRSAKRTMKMNGKKTKMKM